LESAASDVRSAEAQIDSARQRLLNFGKNEAEIAELAKTRHADRTTRVMAPIGGQVVARKVGPGQYIRPDNPDPLFTIADTSTMWLLAEVYESQIPLVRLGERVEVKMLALPSQSFPAQVSYIAPSVDPATRRVAVRCVLRNRNNQLKPEMFASFRFERAPRRALLVPQKAVVQEGNIAVVWVIESGNHVSRRPVDLGDEFDGRIEIKSGLHAGEIVVTDGALFLSGLAKG
jgi:membrane fusion protein, heavy metal efflux system